MSDLVQALTDPENQPNQYGFECFMKGQKMAFKIGNQSFTLDYEPDETDEFNFMRDMLANAFSTFTPNVKNARIEQLERVLVQARDGFRTIQGQSAGANDSEIWLAMGAIESRSRVAIASIDEALNE